MEVKPAFNVVVPFDGVTIIQMNDSMVNILSNLFEDFDDNEPEIDALSKCLSTPGTWARKSTGASFSTEIFCGVTTLQTNQAMADIVKNYINNTDDEIDIEIRALSKAIENPTRCAELRRLRHLKRQEENNRPEQKFTPRRAQQLVD